jgi:uncharacterized protein (DUF433 family)
MTGRAAFDAARAPRERVDQSWRRRRRRQRSTSAFRLSIPTADKPQGSVGAALDTLLYCRSRCDMPPRLTRITRDPAVMGGKPGLRGLRVTVGTVVGLVVAGHSTVDILALYPYLEEELRATIRRSSTSRRRPTTGSISCRAWARRSNSPTSKRRCSTSTAFRSGPRQRACCTG